MRGMSLSLDERSHASVVVDAAFDIDIELFIIDIYIGRTPEKQEVKD